jgi:hypothetical protein
VGDLPSVLLLPEGEAHSILCPIYGWPSPDLFWYRDGIEVASNATLIFTALSRMDAGSYTCVGSNLLGSIATSTLNLTVACESSPLFSTLLQCRLSDLDYDFVVAPSPQIAVVAGQSLTLPCIPPPSFPEASVMWYRDAAPLEMRAGEFGMSVEAGSLVFRNVQISDSGRYVCVAQNPYAIPPERSSLTAQLSVTGE